MSELLTIPETADRLRCGVRTVERWIAEGELVSIKLGRKRLVEAAEVERFLRIAQRRGRVA